MRKFLRRAVPFVLAFVLAVPLAAPAYAAGHSHWWSSGWSSDESHHWHECLEPGCALRDRDKRGYARHDFGSWQYEPGYGSGYWNDGRWYGRYRDCLTCGWREWDYDYRYGPGWEGWNHAHTYTEWYVDVDATYYTDGARHRTCTICGYVQTEAIPAGSGVQDWNSWNGPYGPSNGQVTKPGTYNSSDRITVRYSAGHISVTFPQSEIRGANRAGVPVVLPIDPMGAQALSDYLIEIAVSGNRSDTFQIFVPVQDPGPGTVAVSSAGAPDTASKVVPGGVQLSSAHGSSFRIVQAALQFADIPDWHWAKDAVDYVTARGLFRGTSEGLFDPDGPMTRAMVISVLCRLDGYPSADAYSWYGNAASWAVAHGLYYRTDFGPDVPVTREELALLLWRYAGSPKAAWSGNAYLDYSSVSDSMRTAMAWCVNNRIMNGYGTGYLAPKQTTTRAQVAQVLWNFVQYGGAG